MPSRISFIILMCLLSACTAYQYIPSHHYTTLHKKKGELNASINIFPLGMQAGYSVTDNLFAFATAYTRQKNSKPYQQKEGPGFETFQGSSSEINLGAGYQHRIDNIIFEIMAGGGSGKMDYTHHIDDNIDYNFILRSSKTNFFIEPLLGFRINDYFEIGIFSRFNSVRYHHIFTQAGTVYLHETDLAFMDKKKVNILFLEPGLFFNAGSRNVKFNLQIGGTNEMNGPNIRDRSTLFRSGISFTLFPNENNKGNR